MAARRGSNHSPFMDNAKPKHVVTEAGALCSVSEDGRLSAAGALDRVPVLGLSAVTCEVCRALYASAALKRSVTARHAVVTLGRMAKA